MADLGNPQNTIEILKKYEFSFQKKYGQNFLIDTHVLDKIIRAAEISSDDFVLEIGPGIGTMTQYLAEAARASRPQGFLFGFSGAREALELLAIGSSDSWMNENGGINKEAVQEFLTLARRIYDAQISGITAREAEAYLRALQG